MPSTFGHALDEKFITKLEAEAKKEGWWADVLADPTLLVALRGRYLNVYWRGQSLFCVKSIPSGLKVTTHEKYLLDPKLKSQVSLTQGVFDVAKLVEKGFIPRYEGKKTLADMKKAAEVFSGLEKTGCHEIAVCNPGVIDVEITFPGKVSLEDGSDDKRGPRVDLASLETDGSEARLVFWEAKHYSNGELRASGGQAPVLHQVKMYKKVLSQRRKEIEDSFKKVAEDLVSIKKMGWKRELSPLINDVATGKPLTLGEEPKVGLIIFGFDVGQKNDAGWKGHLELLKKGIDDVRAVGEAKKIRLPK